MNSFTVGDTIRGMLSWEALKSRSSEIVGNTYFSIYAHKGLLDLAVKFFIGSGGLAMSGVGGHQLD